MQRNLCCFRNCMVFNVSMKLFASPYSPGTPDSTTNNTTDRHDITDLFCNFHFLDTTDNTEQLHNKTKYIVERGVKHHKPNPY